MQFAMVGAFKRTLRKPQKKAPTRLYHQVLPPHSRTNPDYKNCCTGYARAKVDIIPETTREVLANGLYCSLLSETSVGDNNCTALRTSAGRVLTSSFFLSCTLMFTTVL